MLNFYRRRSKTVKWIIIVLAFCKGFRNTVMVCQARFRSCATPFWTTLYSTKRNTQATLHSAVIYLVLHLRAFVLLLVFSDCTLSLSGVVQDKVCSRIQKKYSPESEKKSTGQNCSPGVNVPRRRVRHYLCFYACRLTKGPYCSA